MKLDVIQQVDELSESLEKEDQLNSVRAIREVIASLKQYAPTIQQMDDPYVHKLFAKVNDGAVQVARDILKEAYAIANTYVTGILVHDFAFLQRRMAGEEEKDVLIGFYHPEWNPLQSASEDRLQAIQQAVSDLNLDAIYFQSSDVDLEKNIIRGKRMVNGEAVDVESRYPDVIYNKNTGGYRNQDRVQRTLRRTIPFTQHVITDKLHLPLELHGESELTGLFIPAVYVNSTDVVKEFFEEHSVGVLKNTQEERGEGVLFIKKDGDVYTVQGLEGTHTYDANHFYEEIRRRVLPHSYILQRYVRTVTRDGEPYDLRIHPIKNEVGEWEILFSYVRIGSNKGILSNLAAGGRVEETESFLTDLFGKEDGLEVFDILHNVALQVAKDVDRLYGYALDELGLDLTIDDNYQIWMHEVNTGPWTGHYESLRAPNILKYAYYVAQSGIIPHNRFQNPYGYRSKSSDAPRVEWEGRRAIGLLTDAFDEYARSAALLAASTDHPFFVFRAEHVDAEERRIYGHFYEAGEWVAKNVPYPHFIIDRVVKQDDKSYTYLYSEFEDIPMTYDFKPLFLERDGIQNVLFEEEKTRPYLLPYTIGQRVKDVQHLIELSRAVLLRPLREEQGAIFLKQEGKQYVWHETNRSPRTLTRQETRKRLRQLDEAALIQSVQPFETAEGSFVKIRGHFFKEEDDWTLGQVYPLIALTMPDLYIEEDALYYGDLVTLGNANWKRPQEMLERAKTAMREIVQTLDDHLTVDPHHLAVDLGVDGETGECYFLDVTMQEPSSPYVALPTMEATLRYAIEQLEE